jgi:hypothetical protein
MKKLLLALCLALFSGAAFGQIITVRNLTQNTVYFSIKSIRFVSNFNPCGIGMPSSSVDYSILPDTNQIFAIVGIVPISATVYSNGNGCYIQTSVNVGKPCSGYPSIADITWRNSTTCEVVSNPGKVIWFNGLYLTNLIEFH